MYQRRRTAAQWTADNPVLGPGEIGVETDTGKIKFGDGTTAWTALPYAALTPTESQALVDALPEIASADPSELSLSTALGVTTLGLTDVMARLPVQYRTGQYYYSSYHGSATQALTLNSLWLAPVWLRAGTIDRLAINVMTAAASSSVRLCIADDDNGLPDTVLGQTGSLDTSTTGAKEGTVSILIPKNGIYWMGAVLQGATGVAAASFNVGGIGALPLGTTLPDDGTTNTYTLAVSAVTGAIPSPITGTSKSQGRVRLTFRYSA
jgi:hypothetical protein